MPSSKEVTKTDTSVSSLLDSAQVLTASKALLSYVKESLKEKQTKSGKKNLLDETGEEGEEEAAGGAGETPIWLTLTTKQHVLDSRRLQPFKVTVPHPLNTDDESTICIVTADPQRAYKNIVASDEFPADLRNRITRVIDLSHLQKKFKTYDAQRKLYAEHDIFLSDERVINRLPGILGKTFYKTTAKRPVPIVLCKAQPRGADGKRIKASKKGSAKAQTESGSDARALSIENAAARARSPAQIAADIQRAVTAVLIHLSPSTNTAVRVGSASWSAEHIAANVEAVTQALVGKHVPKGWNNVKGLFIKGPQTMALPIWQTDELWVEGKDVLANGSEDLKVLEAKKGGKKEQANIGKKRKAISDVEADEKKPEAGTFGADAAEKKTTKKAKKAKKAKLPESSDGNLDKAIAEHKEKLKKQKSRAKKALDI